MRLTPRWGRRRSLLKDEPYTPGVRYDRTRLQSQKQRAICPHCGRLIICTGVKAHMKACSRKFTVPKAKKGATE